MEKPLAVKRIGPGGAVSLLHWVAIKRENNKVTLQKDKKSSAGSDLWPDSKSGDDNRLYDAKRVCVCVGVVSVCAKCVMMQMSPGYWGMKMQTRLLKQRKKKGGGERL